MNVRYIILELTPFPGTWGPTHTCHLQEAELAAFNQPHYHFRATMVSWSIDTLAYEYDDAQKLIAAMKVQRPYARFMLVGSPVTPRWKWSTQK
jgi:hypothetical protein